MKIVLLQDVKNIGKKGDIKEVADGYALNFILPKKLGVQATSEAVAQAEGEKSEKIQQEKENIEKDRALAKKLEKLEISLQAKEKDGKLFGSITTKNIAQELKNHNFDIPEKCIKLEEVIKKIGVYIVRVNLNSNIKTQLTLKIETQK